MRKPGKLPKHEILWLPFRTPQASYNLQGIRNATKNHAVNVENLPKFQNKKHNLPDHPKRIILQASLLIIVGPGQIHGVYMI